MLIILPAVNVEMLKCRGPKDVLADRSLKHVFLVPTETVVPHPWESKTKIWFYQTS